MATLLPIFCFIGQSLSLSLQTVQQICFVGITSLNGQIFPLNKDLCVCVCVCVCTAPRLLAFCLSLIFLRSPSLSLFLHAYFILSAFFWQVLFAFFILFFFSKKKLIITRKKLSNLQI